MYSNTEIRNKIAAEIMSYRRTAMRLHGYNSNGWLTACSVLRSFAAEFPKERRSKREDDMHLARAIFGAGACVEPEPLAPMLVASVDLSDPLAPVRAAKMRDCWS